MRVPAPAASSGVVPAPAAPLSVAHAPQPARPYRSVLPRRLQFARFGILALAPLWLGLGLVALDDAAGIARVVGQETAPSIVAASQVRAGLAAAHADFAAALLSDAGQDGIDWAAMRQALRGAGTALVEAARNISHGDEDAGPVKTILQGIGAYRQWVGQALASSGDARKALALRADGVMQWSLLPAATALDRVDYDHLNEAYAAYGHGWRELALFGLAALGLLATLIWAQFMIGRATRRLVNPFLVGATLVALGGTLYLGSALLTAEAALTIAKREAFDSIYALWNARAIADNATAAARFSLLAQGDPNRQARFAADFAGRARRLAGDDMTAAQHAAAQGGHVPGFIGDELANITFAGEGEAAQAMLKAWVAVMQRADEVQTLASAGRTAEAVTLATGATPQGATAPTPVPVELRFDDALGRVLAINDRAFADALGRFETATAGAAWVLFAALAAVLVASWVGIKLRLDEYRF